VRNCKAKRMRVVENFMVSFGSTVVACFGCLFCGCGRWRRDNKSVNIEGRQECFMDNFKISILM